MWAKCLAWPEWAAVPAAMALVGSAGLAVSAATLAVDMPVMLLAVIACLPIFFSGHRISRSEGVLFLVYYSTYFVLLYARSATDSFLSRYETQIGGLALAVVFITLVIVVVRAMQYLRHHRKEMGF